MAVKENGQDKIEKICDLLKAQALEPAALEAKQIIKQAEAGAEAIIQKAEKNAENLVKEAMNRISTEQKAAQVALQEAHKQALESLKQEIEKKLFAPALDQMLLQHSNDPVSLAGLINALAEAVNKQGLSSDFSVVVSEKVDVKAVNAALIHNILEQLKEKSVQVGSIGGGALLKLHDQRVTLDVSQEALLELLNKHLRKDFRDKIFAKAPA